MDNVKSSLTKYELSPVQKLTFGAIFLALRVVLGFLEINIGDSYRITFSPIPITLCAYMLGAVFGGMTGMLGDIITLIIHPTGGINFGILFAKTLWGVLMGILLHKKQISWFRVIFANIICITVCNLCITTYSLCYVHGYPLQAILPVRLITNAVFVVLYPVATYYLMILCDRLYHSYRR
ncbi:MAG: folate family ECF transporter S component [Clostridia bacterium]|nr:folate family ECF transporter S component [Clostridia bacterium]